MNQDIKAKWVTALKSGDYKQGKQHLKSKEGFCCLGVLCELYKNEHPEAEWTDYGFRTSPSSHPTDKFLPNAVQSWAGLDSMFGAAIKMDKDSHHLPSLNDGFLDRVPKTFLEIGTAIEEQL